MLVGQVVNDPLLGHEIIPENVIVSPVSVSVAPERRFRDPVLSSEIVSTWFTAVGAELVQLIVTVPVAIFESHPEISSAW